MLVACFIHFVGLAGDLLTADLFIMPGGITITQGRTIGFEGVVMWVLVLLVRKNAFIAAFSPN